MDPLNPLTPNKIQRLMHLAEDASFNKQIYKFPTELKPLGHHLIALQNNMESGACESSSGLLDLDQIQGFGESEAGSISKSTGFFPGEMTGRSTGADENLPSIPMGLSHTFSLDSLSKQLDVQSNEVNQIMRHSIASNFSLHSKNLTANEASFVAKYAPIPVPQARTTIQEPSMIDMSGDSIGGYFRDRCPEFSKVLGHSDSPNRSSMQPSLTEVSHFEQPESLQHLPCKLDPSLDSVPVRQPRIMNEADELEKQAFKQQEQINQLLMNPFCHTDYRLKTEESQNVDPFKKPQSILMPNLEPQKQKVTTGASNEYLVKAVTRCSIKPTGDESSVVDSSLSLSKIAEFLGNHSVVNVSDIIDKYCKKDNTKPLQEANKIPKQELPVTYLKDTRNVESANSGGSDKTVISVKNQENRVIPEVLITRDSLANAQAEKESIKSDNTRSKSPSSRSRSTLSTVKENYSAESPVRTSTDGPWIEIKTTPVKGFVGVNCPTSISITTKSDNWLTATFKYDRSDTTRPLRIELPHQPLLLSPGKTEQLTLNITSNAELSTDIPFIITVKDSSIDSEQEQKGTLSVDFKMPEVQAISSFGPNKVVFSPTQERTLLATTLVLLSDSSVDLQLSLSLVDTKNVFSLKNVQEIKMSEINKILGAAEEKHALAKLKKASSAVQLCRLTKGNAIRATVVFEAPSLNKQVGNELEKYQGSVVVNLIGVEASVKTVELSASVGVASLRLSTQDKPCFTKEPKILQLENVGSLRGTWSLKQKIEDSLVFVFSVKTVELAPGEAKGITVTYKGPQDVLYNAMLTFEEKLSSAKTVIDIQGGTEKFPIKANCHNLSWVRSGRKELSLKNFSDKKVLVRCDIVGDAYTIDVPGVDARGTSCIISFSPNECRLLPIVYAPTTHLPNAATLFMKLDKNNDHVKKISLYGCSSSDALRWVGLATYGETALVRAVARSSIDLKLTNKSPMPAFVCARVNFNLQYMSLAGSCSLIGARHVVRGRGSHTLSLRVDWARVERRAMEARAPTLATLTALTGPEITRYRILRILKDPNTGNVDTSLLPDNLKMLVGPFDGDELDMDSVLKDFEETKASLVDLIGGLQELKAQIDLPVDLSEETIIIVDDTVLEHHTLFE
ncbi:uncharacterized protein LOC125231426 isoform X2 [Leguminivora glycinivorella]|uniref:uncharacterized protein LOC125231426 isoform X2 n=1 Tax=Leguminivora glycinivorella TaxID=1035111 RepID=UPI00200C6ABA|nr:uncharacterized protein LOC125231426 isoform X2 [Leguminivora glycinivorella]